MHVGIHVYLGHIVTPTMSHRLWEAQLLNWWLGCENGAYLTSATPVAKRYRERRSKTWTDYKSSLVLKIKVISKQVISRATNAKFCT